MLVLLVEKIVLYVLQLNALLVKRDSLQLQVKLTALDVLLLV